MAFRYKPAVRVGYARQGYIYFKSLIYNDLNPEEKRRIMLLCKESGGEYYRALFEFVTTQDGTTVICLRHYIGKTTLFRMVKRYYENFPRDL